MDGKGSPFLCLFIFSLFIYAFVFNQWIIRSSPFLQKKNNYTIRSMLSKDMRIHTLNTNSVVECQKKNWKNPYYPANFRIQLKFGSLYHRYDFNFLRYSTCLFISVYPYYLLTNNLCKTFFLSLAQEHLKCISYNCLYMTKHIKRYFLFAIYHFYCSV